MVGLVIYRVVISLKSIKSAFPILVIFFGIGEISEARGLIRITVTIPATCICPDTAAISDKNTTTDSTTSRNAPADTISDARSRSAPVFAVNDIFGPFRTTASDTYEFLYTDGTDRIPPESPLHKSRTRARLYSAALTMVPIIVSRGMSTGYTLSDQSGASLLLIGTGIVAGPSGGSIYAEDWRLARRSILIRGASAATMVTGYLISENVEDDAAGLLMIISGTLVLAGHALYDIFILSAHSVDYYNMRKRMEAGLTFNHDFPDSWSEWAAGTHPRPQPNFQPLYSYPFHSPSPFPFQPQSQSQPQSHLLLPRFTLRFHF